MLTLPPQAGHNKLVFLPRSLATRVDPLRVLRVAGNSTLVHPPLAEASTTSRALKWLSENAPVRLRAPPPAQSHLCSPRPLE